MMHPIMACGHTANGTCSAKGGIRFAPPVPSCVICGCVDLLEDGPILTGRMAKCSCGSTAPSDPEHLAFFEYLGPGSPKSINMCKCGYYRIAHDPRWQATYKQIRRWYKHERVEETLTEQTGCPDEEAAQIWAESKRKQLLHWCDHSPETKVFSVELLNLERTPANIECKTFVAQGPLGFDSYYCGCRGWD